MSGQQPAPRTRFERVDCGDPGIVTFKISGSLGPRSKPLLVRLTQECLRRSLPRVVLDLSEVDALGGGTARLLNEFAAERSGRGGKTAFRVTSRTVSGFLCADPHLPPPPLCASLEEAVAAVRDRATSQVAMATNQALASGSGRGAAPEPLASTAGAARPANHRPSFVPGGPARSVVPDLFLPERDSQDDQDLPEIDFEIDLVDDDPFALVTSRAPAASNWTALAAASNVVELRGRLVVALHERGIAARAFLFEHHPDGQYYLVTRQGVDRERALPDAGMLAATITAHASPTFLVDLHDDGLSEVEAEILTELNCEVAAAIGPEARVLVFLSKEQPGDEYTLEDLQQLEAALAAAASSLRPRPSAAAPVQQPLQAPTRVPMSAVAPRANVRAHEEEPVFAPWGAPLVVEAPPTPPALAAGAAPAVEGGSPSAANSSPSRRDADPETVRPLRRSLTQLRDILRLSQDFDAAFGTSRLLDVLVLSVVSVARVETVLYFAARNDEYRLTHHRGMAPDAIQGLRLRNDTTMVQAALAASRGLALAAAPQVTEEERMWARQHGLSHVVAFRFKDEVLGLLLLGAPAEPEAPDLEMLASLLAQAGLAYDRARLYETLQDRTLGVVRGLITLIESRNGFDCGSTEHVVRYTQALGRELAYPAELVRDLVYGAVLRDVGMLKVSETLLRSAQDLTADQWESIRRHPQEGAAIMRQMRFNETAIDVVLHHHEAYNGEGYPMGLRGRAIPLGARIVAVAESYVKMLMDRPYRKALGKAEALESLAENWGLRYDPLVVDALVRVVNRELSMGLRGDSDLARDLFGV